MPFRCAKRLRWVLLSWPAASFAGLQGLAVAPLESERIGRPRLGIGVEHAIEQRQCTFRNAVHTRPRLARDRRIAGEQKPESRPE